MSDDGWIDPLEHETAVRMLRALPYFAVIVDRDSRYVWSNRMDATLTVAEIRGKRFVDFVHPDSQERAGAALRACFESGESGYYEARAYGAGEMDTWYATTVVPFERSDGERYAMLLSTDVTERRAAQAALERSEERFRRLVEESPDQIAITGPDLLTRYLNKPPPPTSTFTLEDILGTPIPDLTHPEYRETAAQAIRSVLEGGPQTSYQAVGLREPGRRYEVRVQPFPAEDDEPRVLLVTRDITDRHKAELLQHQLLQSQKMDLLGQLAGGVAHDFNNLLTVILNNASLAARDAPEDGRTASLLDEIMRTSQRAAELTGQLLAFSRKQPRRSAPIGVEPLIDGVLRMIERILPETVTVAWPRHDAPGAVLHADQAQLEQVLMNLCVNARDAMPDGGELSLRTGVVRLAEDDPRVGTDGAGEYVEIAVGDTGTGMEAAVAARIFEPFFTTKPVGRGTGLGMSVALGIIEAHGGSVEVDSEPDRGTTVYVRLPIAAGEPASGPEPVSSELPTRALRVLVVDDDALVRHSLARVLEFEGYEVRVAGGGREALEIARSDAAIDVVILDVVMPDIGGAETYAALLELRPDLPAVFATGYGRNMLSNTFLRGHGAEVIDKPYRPDTLLAAIARAIGE